jgi:hypothetical protein
MERVSHEVRVSCIPLTLFIFLISERVEACMVTREERNDM